MRFIMEAGNNRFAPHILQQVAFGLLTLVLILSFLVSDTRFLLLRSSDWLLGAILPAVVVEKTNEARALIAAVPLKRSAVLDEAARLKAEHMSKSGYFAHYSPDGVSPWYWFEKVGYVYAHAGENLAIHFTDSKKVVDAWMDSPTHRANIESLNYLEIGVGTAKGNFEGHETIFVVQLFGTPAAPLLPNVVESSESDVAIDIADDEEREINDTVVLGEAVDTVPEVTADEKSDLELSTVADLAIGNTVDTRESFLATTSSLLPISTYEYEVMTKSEIITPNSVRILEPDNKLVMIIYTVLLGLILLLVFTVLFTSVRFHRPWQLVYSLVLLVLLWGVTSVTELLWLNI